MAMLARYRLHNISRALRGSIACAPVLTVQCHLVGKGRELLCTQLMLYHGSKLACLMHYRAGEALLNTESPATGLFKASNPNNQARPVCHATQTKPSQLCCYTSR